MLDVEQMWSTIEAYASLCHSDNPRAVYDWVMDIGLQKAYDRVKYIIPLPTNEEFELPF